MMSEPSRVVGPVPTGAIINKTMNRADLMAPDAVPIGVALNALIHSVAARGLSMSAWNGSLALPPACWRRWLRRVARRPVVEAPAGLASRGLTYEPLPGAADDARFPWYLYWEIAWVMRHGPALRPGMRILDAGGASSLFSCYLASIGCEVHAVDCERRLVRNCAALARGMHWPLHGHAMDLAALDFPDAYFDHAYSICVFEHLDCGVKQAALSEIARCLRPQGRLSLTFDYRNPAPYVAGVGADPRPRNRLSTPEDVRRTFLASGRFVPVGNAAFTDDGTSWLLHPAYDTPYTFGALFLARRGET